MLWRRGPQRSHAEGQCTPAGGDRHQRIREHRLGANPWVVGVGHVPWGAAATVGTPLSWISLPPSPSSSFPLGTCGHGGCACAPCGHVPHNDMNSGMALGRLPQGQFRGFPAMMRKATSWSGSSVIPSSHKRQQAGFRWRVEERYAYAAGLLLVFCILDALALRNCASVLSEKRTK